MFTFYGLQKVDRVIFLDKKEICTVANISFIAG